MRKIQIGTLLTLSLVVGTVIVFNHKQDDLIAEKMNALEAEGVNFSMQDFFSNHASPVESNIQPEFDKVQASTVSLISIPQYRPHLQALRPTTKQVERIYEYPIWMSKNTKMVDSVWKLVELAKQKNYYFRARKYTAPMEVIFPEFSMFRGALKLILNEAEKARDEGRWEDSLSIVRKGIPFLNLKFYPEDDLAFLVRVNTVQSFYTEIRKLASMPNANLDHLSEVLRQLPSRIDFKKAKQLEAGELAINWNQLPIAFNANRILRGMGFIQTMIKIDFLNKSLRLMHNIDSLQDENPDIIEVNKLNSQEPNDDFLNYIHVDVSFHDFIYQQMFYSVASERMTSQVIELFKIFRASHQFPPSLPNLNGTLNQDPLSRKPFGYKASGSGFKIWSVDQEGHDSGGIAPTPSAGSPFYEYYEYP